MVRFIWNFLPDLSCSYLQYSSLCARYLRRALKPEFREAAILKKEDSTAKMFRWKEGKPEQPGMSIG